MINVIRGEQNLDKYYHYMPIIPLPKEGEEQPDLSDPAGGTVQGYSHSREQFCSFLPS